MNLPVDQKYKDAFSRAEEYAVVYGEDYVTTEYLLLGLLAIRGGNAARVLRGMGLTKKFISLKTKEKVCRGKGNTRDPELQERVVRVVDLAFDEALHLGSKSLGTEHILLGLIRLDEGLAARVLKSLGVNLEKARDITRQVQEKAI